MTRGNRSLDRSQPNDGANDAPNDGVAKRRGLAFCLPSTDAQGGSAQGIRRPAIRSTTPPLPAWHGDPGAGCRVRPIPCASRGDMPEARRSMCHPPRRTRHKLRGLDFRRLPGLWGAWIGVPRRTTAHSAYP